MHYIHVCLNTIYHTVYLLYLPSGSRTPTSTRVYTCTGSFFFPRSEIQIGTGRRNGNPNSSSASIRRRRGRSLSSTSGATFADVVEKQGACRGSVQEGARPSLSSAEITRQRFRGLVEDRRHAATARNGIWEARTDPRFRRVRSRCRGIRVKYRRKKDDLNARGTDDRV